MWAQENVAACSMAAARMVSRPAVEQPADGGRPVVGVVAVDQHAADPVAHRDGQPADRGRHHRRAAGLGLDGDQSERLGVAGHRHHVGGAVHVDELLAGLRR